MRTAHGNLYVNITFDTEGKPFEVFATLGKAGSCERAAVQAISKLASHLLRSGVHLREVATQLSGLRCCPHWDDGHQIESVADGIALVLARYKEGAL